MTWSKNGRHGLGDASGPRMYFGGTWFTALVQFRQARDRALKQLDRARKCYQFLRILYRLNGWKWTSTGQTIDPIRDSWFEAVTRDCFEQCHQRGIRIHLASGDFNDWNENQQRFWHRRIAEIARSVHPHLIANWEITNEMRGTWNGGESDANIERARELIGVVKDVLPEITYSLSDPESQDKAGMQRLTPSPFNVSPIHQVRWPWEAGIRRFMNDGYENDPGFPMVDGEGTGATEEFQRLKDVWQPVERPEHLFAIRTMSLISGHAVTDFNDAGLVARTWLDAYWGSHELPTLWKQMGIPEHIGTGRLIPGHREDMGAPIRIGKGAARCDSVSLDGGKLAFGIVSGSTGEALAVPSGMDADLTRWGPRGLMEERRVSAGEVFLRGPASSPNWPPDPAVYRLVAR